jgi:heme-degrading monooxygenase HmoA
VIVHTPDPPYCAVIFTARRTNRDDGYAETFERLRALAAKQPGFLGIDSAGEREEITVSYWATEADAAAWKLVATHVEAQRLGRERWYEQYVVRVATVTRALPRTVAARVRSPHWSSPRRCRQRAN